MADVAGARINIPLAKPIAATLHTLRMFMKESFDCGGGPAPRPDSFRYAEISRSGPNSERPTSERLGRG